MPQNITMNILPRVWTRVTTAAVTALRLQHQGPGALLATATAGTAQPGDDTGAIMLQPGDVILADMTLAEIWPGIAGANHVWCRSSSGGQVSVSHA